MEQFEDSWEYTDPITDEINEQVYKGRAVPILGDEYDQ